MVKHINGIASFQAMNVDSSSILLRSSDFLQQYGIEVLTQKEVISHKEKEMVFVIWSHNLAKTEMYFVSQVVSVNPPEKAVKMSDGTLQHYDQLLISTGCRLDSFSCSSNQANLQVFRLFSYI